MHEKRNVFETFTQLQPSDISYKVRDQPKQVKQYVLGEILGEGMAYSICTLLNKEPRVVR